MPTYKCIPLIIYQLMNYAGYGFLYYHNYYYLFSIVILRVHLIGWVSTYPLQALLLLHNIM